MRLTRDGRSPGKFKPSKNWGHRIADDGDLRRVNLIDGPLSLTIAFLLGGFALFDRAFAYLHIPGTQLFIGELVLVPCFVYVLAVGKYRYLGKYSVATFFAAIFVLWSIFRSAEYLNDYGADAIRDSAVWYYAVLGLVVYRLIVLRGPAEFTRRYDKLVVLALVWYPIALLLTQFGGRSFTVPDSDVSIFSHKLGNLAVGVSMAISWIWLCRNADTPLRIRKRLLLTSLGVVTLLMAGIINRGGLVAAALALLVAWSFSGPHLRRSGLAIPLIFVAILGLFWLLDVRIQLPFTQREISASQLVDNLRSIVGDQPADDPGSLDSTVSWRLDLWARTIEDIDRNAPLTGRGYGVNLGILYGVQGDFDAPLRSPHNSHLTVFARSGWIGLAGWVALWIAWFSAVGEARRRQLARGNRDDGNLALWCAVSVVAIHVNAFFDPALESPQVSAWLWSLFGLGLGLWHHARWPSVHNTGGDNSVDGDDRTLTFLSRSRQL